jgi:hypothetical protein
MIGSDLTIEMLRRAAGREPLDPAEWKRVKARVAWVRETVAALQAAHKAMDERCLAAVGRVPEEEFERICDEEQAKVCAILDQLNVAGERDEWPRHLYFGGI